MPDLPATKLLVILYTALFILLPSTAWAVSLPSALPSSLPSVQPSSLPSAQPSSLPSALPSSLPSEHTSSNLQPELNHKSIHSASDVSRILPSPVEELKKEIQSLRNYQGGLLKHVKQWRVRRDARTPWWKKFLNFSKKKGNTGPAADLILQPESDRRTGGRAAKLANSKGIPGTTQSQRPPIEQPRVSNLTRMLGGILPNTYFSKPRFRYPYYDRRGKGHLLYGYGEKDLYEYSVFKPLEGYY